jgi:hypothetical protein
LYPKVEKDIFILRLPVAFPVQVEFVKEEAKLGFSQVGEKSAAEILKIFENLMTRIVKKSLFVAKLINVHVSVVTKDRLRQLERKMNGVILSHEMERNSFMHCCDVNLTIVMGGSTIDEPKLWMAELNKLVKEGEIFLCQRCQAFFRDGEKCVQNQDHMKGAKSHTFSMFYMCPYPPL